MGKHNAANERIKRDYFEYLREAKRLSSPSIDAAAKAISRFEESTGWKDFRAFHIKQAVAFKARLAQQTSQRTGAPLSKATLYSTLQALRSFFLWLADRPGFKHVDLERACVSHDARDVNTKFSKSFTTTFFPIGDEAERIVADWVAHLRSRLLWCDEDPLFPATRVEAGPDRQVKAAGLDRRCWTTAGPIRKVFRNAFGRAALPYFNPHSFRDMLAQLGERICTNPEAMKAWSQNLGHEKVLTTLLSYGKVSASRQTEIMRAFNAPTPSEPSASELVERLAALEARLKE